MQEIIFEADTPAGKAYDVVLILCIVLSVAAAMLDSVQTLQTRYRLLFFYAEWSFTILFTLDYVLRLICVARPSVYARSFFGVIDFISITPTYLGLLFPGTRFLLMFRLLRLLRIFRVFKLVQYVNVSHYLLQAMRASRRKIAVFLFTVLILVTILGSLMYVIEGGKNGFTSIPMSIYWSIVTLTTVGYGDISPQTPLGQALASVIMIIGYSIIAVPTGIVTAEVGMAMKKEVSTQACPRCGTEGHDTDAVYCKKCGGRL